MTLSEHYKYHSRKSLKSYTRLLFLVVLFVVVFQTLARYSSNVSASALAQVAKWSITINGEEITANKNSLNQQISLINAIDGTTKIDADDECYFDIIINPNGTEVSIINTILIDLSDQGNTLPEGTTVLKYETYIGNDEELDISKSKGVNNTSVTIKENINLLNVQESLENADIRKYRIYCKLPKYINVEQGQEYKVTPTITVKQNIGE